MSTSRHVSQGGVDLLEVAWDEAGRRMSGRSKVVKDDPYQLILRVPKGYAISGVKADCPVQAEGIEQDIQRVSLRPVTTGIVSWQLQFTSAR